MGLEPGTAAEIQTFCSSTIRRDVPLLAESDVNGPDRHLLYAELTKTADVDGQAGDVQWNFREIPRRTGRGGQPVPGARYR